MSGAVARKLRACAAIALGAAALVSIERAAAQDDAAPAAAAEESTPLVRSMEVLRDGLRVLRPEIADPAKLAARLDLVVEMQSAAKATKTMPIPLADAQPEAERAAFVLAYRKEMIAVEEELLRLERAILDGDAAAAKACYKTLKQMEEDGHARFTEDG